MQKSKKTAKPLAVLRLFIFKKLYTLRFFNVFHDIRCHTRTRYERSNYKKTNHYVHHRFLLMKLIIFISYLQSITKDNHFQLVF